MTPPTCLHCRGPLVVTRDAIGRPRYRCPECQGVNRSDPAPGTAGVQHPQTAGASHELDWGAPAPQSGPVRPQVAPDRRASCHAE